MLTSSLPTIENCLENLKREQPLKQRIHALEIAVVNLRQCADQHRAYQLDFARAMAEQQKRDALNPEGKVFLQTTPYKVGRERTRQVEAENAKRAKNIQMGRVRKRSAPDPSKKRRNKRRGV